MQCKWPRNAHQILKNDKFQVNYHAFRNIKNDNRNEMNKCYEYNVEN